MLSIKSKHYYALVDCNNFYASCERVFNPSHKNTPIVVLSNNDGCIIARSSEAKLLGIPMAAPFHMYKSVILNNKVKTFSSNYQLYGDMSKRVMDSLHLMCEDLEVYSIDEAFLKLNFLNEQQLYNLGTDIKNNLLKWLGIPVSIGIASSKTLAKLANKIAKKNNNSVLFIPNSNSFDNYFKNIPVDEIWGISKKFGNRLNEIGIHTVYDLKYASPFLIKSKFNILLKKIVYELNGFSCDDLKDFEPKKQIMSSKSFGYSVSDISVIKEALSNYIARACEKLRSQNSKAMAMTVFLRTNKFRNNEKQMKASKTHYFEFPLSCTNEIIKIAKNLIDDIYQPNYKYHKTGVMLFDLVDQDYLQQRIFSNNKQCLNSENMMPIVDKINSKLGKNSIYFLAQGIKREWQMRSDHKSPCYTTKWEDLPIIH